jgi:hypothetical protein
MRTILIFFLCISACFAADTGSVYQIGPSTITLQGASGTSSLSNYSCEITMVAFQPVTDYAIGQMVSARVGYFMLPESSQAPAVQLPPQTGSNSFTIEAPSLETLQEIVNSTTAKQIEKLVADNLAAEAALLVGIGVLKRKAIAGAVGL